MLTTVLASMLLAPVLPENPSFDYSGLPSVPKTSMKTHGVQVDMSTEKVATITSTTVVKNEGTEPLKTIVSIPRRRVGDAKSGNPSFQVKALWNNQPLSLVATSGIPRGQKLDIDNKSYVYKSDVFQQVTLGPGQTCSLKITYSIPFGRCGFEQKQKIAGYLFEGDQTVGLVSLSYRYGGPTVFRLPEAFPKDWGWQVGAKGVFRRLENFTPNGELTYITFYPGGFDRIG
jgi:hypothetical protein